MPGSVTHYLFGMDCFDKLESNILKNIIKENKKIYSLGCQGPNFFSYYNHLPIFNSKNLAVIDDLIHTKNINEFINNMFVYSDNTYKLKYIFNNENFSNITLAYICGFLSHYTLDTISHPYIYSFQLHLKDSYKVKSPKYLHKSIETHIDSLLLDKFKDLSLEEFSNHLDFDLSSSERLILFDMYRYLIKQVYNKSIVYNDIEKCLDMFIKTENKLNNNNNLKSITYLYMKKYLSKTSYIESKLYNNHKICKNNLLNTNNTIWKNPFSNSKCSKSFFDIYDDALAFYIDLLNILGLYLENKKTMTHILDKIGDKSYLTNQNWKLNINNL